ncbi:FxDxF family PEP-CTERM protein [Edaphosphingomonas haloaromaticamans]|uniref:Ice-binding protein C-terminal domain-containing protein n=1 Tax=Edaphosphingomonas haloaromaticamans TaxID=653954 RepID=A0A1S1HD64_9SPHN|nr:FxDxF family PEP-CTERM protein [Sphingomonas haloaromaticamans]OHT20169.1 hypothetical protein BHE75_02164 [Sphingomonas haloaromaticamans]
MKKFLVAASIMASALIGSQAASAAVFPINVSQGSNYFGNTGLSNGTGFTDTFTFTLSEDMLANLTVFSISLGRLQNVDFTSIQFDGRVLQPGGGNGNIESWYLDPIFLTAGEKVIEITYNVSGASSGSLASYSGILNIAAVPEPATWAMMLVGFGVVGASMRRRNSGTRLPQAA